MTTGELSIRAHRSTVAAKEEWPMASTRAEARGTVLAFDFGMKRIGVATGDTTLAIAHPLDTIEFEDNRRRFEAIAALIEEWHPVSLVVGCPRTDYVAEHPLAAPVQRFCRRLEARFGLPVDVVDEHLSSWSASRRLSQTGVPARDQKRRIDAMAACVILDSWFEARRSGAVLPRGGQ
jgi:putative holliday junction resolvase